MPRSAAFLSSLLLATLVGAGPALSAIEQRTDENGLRSWTLHDGALELQLIPRLPDQTRAFFLARGFPADVADRIARACVFQVIGKNVATSDAPHDIRIDLRQWRITHRNQTVPIKLKEVWAEQWPDDVPNAARIAFRWATFPTDQVYHPADDHNWGMVSLGPPPGSILDLDVVWFEDGRHKHFTIEGLDCPTDPE